MHRFFGNPSELEEKHDFPPERKPKYDDGCIFMYQLI